MSISAIRLRRFRGFRDAGVQLKPLTVLLGCNSAGKSSFGNALAALAHAQKAFASGPQASLTPRRQPEEWPVDLGETQDLRTRGEDGPVCVEFTTRGGLVELGFGGLKHTGDLALSYLVHPSDEQSAPSVAPPPSEATKANTVVESTTVPFERVVSESDRTIRLRKINEVQWRDGESEASVIFDGLLVKAVTHLTGSARVISGQAASDLRALLETLCYLRPNREPPSRRYPDKIGTIQHVGYSGEFTSGVLNARRATPVVHALPPQIPTTPEEARSAQRDWKLSETTLGEGLKTWLTHFRLAQNFDIVPVGESGASIELRVSLDDNNPRDITEVGFGISQIIPVVVAGLLQPKDSLFVVDLPEAHLHPRAQAVVADFFCSLAMSSRSVLIETHSEMFFHRLRLRAAMSPTLLERIAVYFIDAPKDGLCATPRLVELGYEDEIRWPEGFLQEAWETESQISLVRGSVGA